MQVFHLFTNRDDLLQFRDTRLDMAGGEESAIGLRFVPSTHRQVVDVMVFINDEEDKNEETFCVRTTYQ
jgi:nephrocystin-4